MVVNQAQTMILVDGSSFIYRAFHALPPLTNSKGMDTGAIYGTINMLKGLMAEEPPRYIALVFDPRGPTARHQYYPDYKANRAAMPDALAAQIAPLHTLLKAMGYPVIIQEGMEADDVIGTLVQRAREKHLRVVIATGDKDMAQLVDSEVVLINTMTHKRLDVAGVKEKYGVRPDQIIDYLALMGDSSDNIPGIPKVGPKTAAKWLQAYGSVDELIRRADEIGGKIGENLRAHTETVRLAKRLVTIDTQCDVDIAIEACVMQPGDETVMRELFTQLEFKQWLKKLPQVATAESVPVRDYHVVTTQDDLRTQLARLQTEEVVAVDVEATHLDVRSACLVGISFASLSGEACYIPLGHDDATKQLALSWVIEQVSQLLAASHILFVGHDLKYDFALFNQIGLPWPSRYYDTMLVSYVLNSTAGRHDLVNLAMRYLSRSVTTHESVVGKGAKQIPFNQVSVDQASAYAIENAQVMLALYQHMDPLLHQDPALVSLITQIEFPLLAVLTHMEARGVCIDPKVLHEQSEEITQQLALLNEQAYVLAGETFNLNSPQQLQAILFDKLGLPVIQKTPTGMPATSEEVLQALSADYELPQCVLSYRSLSKLKSTYTDRLPQDIHAHTGRVHCAYNQAVTATGRLSSSDPNLQNIPIRTSAGRRIRQAFIAPEGMQLLSADYSQVELRIMAHCSQDAGLIRAFCEGQDIHRATAAEVFEVDIASVSGEQRRQAKAVNFGLIYGMSAFGLAKNLNIPREAAQTIISRYFERYPGVKAYMDKTCQLATKQGYVETLLGRRLYLPGLQDRQMGRRRAAERAAINAPMQGTAADIMKLAMIKIDQILLHTPQPVHMIMQVHDELVFEVADVAVEWATTEIRRAMEQAYTLDVPLVVNVGLGKNWGESHPL